MSFGSCGVTHQPLLGLLGPDCGDNAELCTENTCCHLGALGNTCCSSNQTNTGTGCCPLEGGSILCPTELHTLKYLQMCSELSFMSFLSCVSTFSVGHAFSCTPTFSISRAFSQFLSQDSTTKCKAGLIHSQKCTSMNKSANNARNSLNTKQNHETLKSAESSKSAGCATILDFNSYLERFKYADKRGSLRSLRYKGRDF